jgi:hypothetical protein
MLDHWWRIAALRRYPLTHAELAMIERARSGDFHNWRPGPNGPQGGRPAGVLTRRLEFPDAYCDGCSVETQQLIGSRITGLRLDPYPPDADYEGTYDSWTTSIGTSSGIIAYLASPKASLSADPMVWGVVVSAATSADARAPWHGHHLTSSSPVASVQAPLHQVGLSTTPSVRKR